MASAPTPTQILPSPNSPDVKFLELPNWMKDTGQNILMYRMLGDHGSTDQQSTVHFLNPDIHLEFTLEMPDAFMCWHDNSRAVFVHDPDDDNEPLFLYVLDLSSGSLVRYSENEPQFQNYYFYTWMCDSKTHQNPPSPEYDLEVELIQNEQTTSIINNRTGTVEILTDPKDDIEDIGATFSPGYKYIAVFQVNDKSNYSAGYFLIRYRFMNLAIEDYLT